MKIYFGISFLLCFFTAYGEKILPVKIKCVYNSCQSQFLIMDSEKPLTIIYDMEIDYTYLYKDIFKKEQKFNNETATIGLKGTVYTGTTLNNDFIFTGINQHVNLTNFLFIIIPERGLVTNTGSIGLNYKIYSDQYSFLHQLKKFGYIEHLSFGFNKLFDNGQESEIYFGGVPENIIKNKNKAIIHVNENYTHWGFNLSSFYFGEHQFPFDNDKYAFINVENDRVFAPLEAVEHIINTAFKEYIENQICVYSKKKNRLYVNCKCSKIHDFPSMTFIIDKHLIEIPGEDLFHPVTSDNNCLFLVQRNYLEGKENTWFFGNKFLKTLVSEFNYEDKAIYLYSDKPIEVCRELINNYTHSKVVLIITIIISLLGIIGLLYRKIRKI